MPNGTESLADFFEGAQRRRRTAVDEVTDAVRAAIERGVLRPGEKVNEERLAEHLNVSRMPVRQALRALAAEGLIKLIPHVGAVVTKLTIDELEELYHLRASLEALLMGRAVSRYSDADLAALRLCLEETDLSNITSALYSAANYRFHQLLYMPSGWSRVMDVVGQIRRNATRYVYTAVADPAMFERSHAEHWAIYRACEARNADLAQRLIHEHVLRVGQSVIERQSSVEAAESRR